MTRDDIFIKVKDVLVEEFELDPAAVIPEAKLFDDLDLDSIDAVDLIVKMKQYVPGKIDPELFKSVRTVENIVDVLYPLIESKSV
jgi:acyl carrier protein